MTILNGLDEVNKQTNMVGLTESDKIFFPLRCTDAVVQLFREHLVHRKEPNLALLSIILGALENNLTVVRCQMAKQKSELVAGEESPDVSSAASVARSGSNDVPALQLSIVETLNEQFVTIIKGSVDLSGHTSKFTTVQLMKKISDVIWGMLTRNFYKDKPHLQTVFSLLTGMMLARLFLGNTLL